MSDLQKAWAKAKLTTLEPFDELAEQQRRAAEWKTFGVGSGKAEEEEDGEEEGGDALGDLPEPVDDDSSSASSASSTGTVIPSPSQRLFARPQNVDRTKNLDQIPWTTYFERELFLANPATSVTHHAYLSSPSGKAPLFVFHHGAGSSGLSFALLACEIRKQLPSAGMLSLDARGHGSTAATATAKGTSAGTSTNPASAPTPPAGTPERPAPDLLDLSLETLTADLLFVILAAKERMHWAELPSVVLVGHSLGGAVVTNLARQGSLGPSVLGFAVLDVVEGSAMDALQSMITYLSTRPAGFASLQAGVDWHVRSRTIRNLVSARTSVPALLVKEEEGEEDEPAAPAAATTTSSSSNSSARGSTMGAGAGAGEKAAAARRPWRWKTDLAATQRFWEGWFVGLSKKFLEARGGKLLLLAGTDRLDTELMIGQMQGKYALQVFPEAGHFIHEDIPEKTALVIVDFYRRNDRSALVLPPKVSDLIRQGKRV